MLRSYYLILNLDKNATLQEIKKAYRKLAMKHHPDKNGNNKLSLLKFKLLCLAYLVLSDKEKRQLYDMFGKQGNTSSFDQMFRGGFGFSDIFLNIFNHQNPFTRGKRVLKGLDIVISVLLELKDVLQLKGMTQSIDVKHKCTSCNGTRSLNGMYLNCTICNGTGVLTQHFQMGPGMYGQQQQPCNNCHATGQIPKLLCKWCKGTGYLTIKLSILFTIPRGILNNVSMRIPGRGNHNKDVAGDAIVNIHIKLHLYFIRLYNHLIYKAKVPYYDLILGNTITIQDLNNNDLQIVIPAGTKDSIVIKLMGIYSIAVNNGTTLGDLHVVILCILPTISLMKLNLLNNIKQIQEMYSELSLYVEKNNNLL